MSPSLDDQLTERGQKMDPYEFDPTEGITAEMLENLDLDKSENDWRDELTQIAYQRQCELDEIKVDDLLEGLRQVKSFCGGF